MSNGEIIKRQLLAWKRRRYAVTLIEGAVDSFFLLVSLLAALILADSFFGFSKWARQAFFAAACAVLAWRAWGGCLRPFLKSDYAEFLSEISLRVPSLARHIGPAWELMSSDVPSNVSTVFVSEHLSQTREIVSREVSSGLSVGKIFPFVPGRVLEKRAVFSLFLGIAALPFAWNNPGRLARAAWPFGEIPLERYVRITPGSAQVPWGRPAAIEARWLSPRRGEHPSLRLRTLQRGGGAGPWRDAELAESGGALVYRVSSLVEAVEYQMFFEGLESSRYTISPRDFPFLKDEKVRVTFPPYTGKQAYTEASVPESMELPAGSWVEISGIPDRKLSSAELVLSESAASSAGGVPLRARLKFSPDSGGRVIVSFQAEKSVEYFLSLVSEDGWTDPSPASHRISALEDKLPSVELLSPSFEMEASPGDEVPVVCDARDEIGLASVEIVREVKAGGIPLEHLRSVQQVKSFGPPGPDRWLGDSALDLSGCPDGAEVEFYLRARDHLPAAMAGYRKGVFWGESARGRARIRDFGKIHQALQRELLEMGQSASRLSEKEKNIIYALENSTFPVSDSILGEIQDGWRELSESAGKNASASESDPYLNPGLAEQYRAMSDTLAYLKERDVPDAVAAAKKREPGAARKHLNLKKELDRVSKAVRDGASFQAMKDLEAGAGQSESLGRSMEQMLGEMEAGRPGGDKSGDWESLGKMVEKIQEQLRELFSTIEAMPRPDGLTAESGEKKVFQVPVGAAMSLAQMLSQAIAEKNIDRAKALAKALLEQLGRARQALSEAADYQRKQDYEDSAVSKKLEQAQALWQEVTEDETSALSGSQKLEDSRLQKMLEKQKKNLKELITKQGLLVESARVEGRNFPPAAFLRMNGVLEEFKNGKIEKSPEELGRIISEVSESAKKKTEGRGALEAVEKGEREVLALLEDTLSQKIQLSEGEAAGFEEASSLQKKVRGKALGLASKFEELEAGSMSVSPEIRQRLGLAAGEMEKAEASLDSKDGESAVSHQAKAIEELEKGRKLMEDSMRSQQDFESGMGQSVPAGRPVARRAGGRTGTNISPVKLPEAADYRPPAEIRKEVMESLQERYPKSQEKTITDYLKRLSE